MHPAKSQQCCFRSLKRNGINQGRKDQGQQLRTGFPLACYPSSNQQKARKQGKDDKADAPGIMKHTHLHVADPSALVHVSVPAVFISEIELETGGTIAKNRMV